MAFHPAIQLHVHSNPVFQDYFADPFAWRAGDSYYAVGTGRREADGDVGASVFPLLRSDDFLHWRYHGTALLRPDPALGANFWAPEVAAHDGQFFLYYSVGHGDKRHQLRVAVSDRPEGPYKDSGKPLIDLARCPFAIDPHPFQDDDGHWYLFFARDFLDETGGARPGTGLAMRRMKSMTELEDKERVVLRARSDWQRFQANRSMYGRTWDWHTLEGPFVRKHAGLYYCFYSGGRWETESYGVDYGIADTIVGLYSDAGNEAGARVLRTIPGKLFGPGHNSVVKGPDGELDYLVYHAWNDRFDARQMCIDPLMWTPDGPRRQVAGM
jgi:beta-xylosidase